MIERVGRLLLAGAAWGSVIAIVWLVMLHRLDPLAALGGGVLLLIIALGAGWQAPAKGKP